MGNDAVEDGIDSVCDVTVCIMVDLDGFAGVNDF